MKNTKFFRGIKRVAISVMFAGLVVSTFIQPWEYLVRMHRKTPENFHRNKRQVNRIHQHSSDSTYNTVAMTTTTPTSSTVTTTKHDEVEIPPFVQAKDMRVYMFSAFIYENRSETNNIFNGYVKAHGFFNMKQFLKNTSHNSISLQEIGRPNTNYTKPIATKAKVKLVINAWNYLNIEQENNTIPVKVDFACCVLLKNKSVLTIPSNNIRAGWYRFQTGHLEPLEHVCSFEGSFKIIEAVSLVGKVGRCPQEKQYYIKSAKVEHIQKPGIIVCAKVAFGDLNGARLVEWFESVRLLGASKVLVYTYKLNERAWRVIDHYESIGLVQHFPFDFPEKDMIPREFEDASSASVQMWKDEVITVVDCQERMAGYQYAMFLDVDEFLLPVNMPLMNSWLRYLNKKFHQDRRLAGLMFLTHMHATSWGPTNPEGELFVERFANGTTGLFDRMKFVFKPDRVMEGTCTAHSFTAKPGYKTTDQSTAKMSEIGIHHYRSCRKEWDTPTKLLSWWKEDYFDGDDSTVCFNYNRRYSPVVMELAEMIRADVKKVQDLLNVQLNYSEKKK